MKPKTLAAAATACALLATPAAALGAKPADSTALVGKRVHLSSKLVVKAKPGLLYSGLLTKGTSIKIAKLSGSGKYAYGYAYGHVQKHAWVLTRDLLSAASASASNKFSIRVANSGAAGDPGHFYVGGPINVTVTGRAPAKTFEVCLTPAPIERASCRHGRVGQTVSSLGAPSKAGKTKLRVSFGQNKVYIKYLTVRKTA